MSISLPSALRRYWRLHDHVVELTPDVVDEVTAAALDPCPVVVSRFAVRIRQRSALPDETWMRDRARLFARFTLPSLEKQGIDGLVVLLLVDPSLRQAAEETLGQLETDRVRLHVTPVTGEPGHRLATEPAALPVPRSRRVLSVRLDSDDMLLPGILLPLVGLAERVDAGGLFDLFRGYRVDADKPEARHAGEVGQGPFLAIVNRPADVLDVGEFHPQAREGRTVYHVDEPAWVQVIHQHNVMNEMCDAATWGDKARAALRGRSLVAFRFGRRLSEPELHSLLHRTGLEG